MFDNDPEVSSVGGQGEWAFETREKKVNSYRVSPVRIRWISLMNYFNIRIGTYLLRGRPTNLKTKESL